MFHWSLNLTFAEMIPVYNSLYIDKSLAWIFFVFNFLYLQAHFFRFFVFSTPTGVETPDVIDLRKQQRKEPERPLYQVSLSTATLPSALASLDYLVDVINHIFVKVLEEKEEKLAPGTLLGTTHTYAKFYNFLYYFILFSLFFHSQLFVCINSDIHFSPVMWLALAPKTSQGLKG